MKKKGKMVDKNTDILKRENEVFAKTVVTGILLIIPAILTILYTDKVKNEGVENDTLTAATASDTPLSGVATQEVIDAMNTGKKLVSVFLGMGIGLFIYGCTGYFGGNVHKAVAGTVAICSLVMSSIGINSVNEMSDVEGCKNLTTPSIISMHVFMGIGIALILSLVVHWLDNKFNGEARHNILIIDIMCVLLTFTHGSIALYTVGQSGGVSKIAKGPVYGTNISIMVIMGGYFMRCIYKFVKAKNKTLKNDYDPTRSEEFTHIHKSAERISDDSIDEFAKDDSSDEFDKDDSID
jgi:hypothetical protein